MTFVELLDHYRIPHVSAGQHRHATHGRISLDCCHCSPHSGKFKLGYHLSFHFLNCWTCGYLPLHRTLAVLTGESESRIGRLLDRTERPRIAPEEVSGTLSLPKGIGPLLEPHRRYLKKRGFDPSHLETFWGVRGIGLATKLAWRIFIPIHLHGEIVSWTTRTINDETEPRYITAPKMSEKVSARKTLFGIDHATHSIIVCEGSLDAIAIGPGAVATMGVGYSRAQLALIAKFPMRAICFDNEPDAQKRAKQLCRNLEVMPGKTFRVELEGKDAASTSEKERRLLRKSFLE